MRPTARGAWEDTGPEVAVVVDLIIVALVVAVASWGYSQGVSMGVLLLVGFGCGAVLGSRLAPLALEGGLHDPFAPVLALPAALLFGAVLAAGLERLARSLRRRLRRHRTLDAASGTLAAGCLGLVLVWITAAVLTSVDGARGSLRDSEIVARLNSVLLPPGPLLTAEEPSPSSSSLRVVDGPRVRAGLADPRIKQDPQVQAAARSVAKIEVAACGHRGEGTGWVAADGIVVTNAHVANGSPAPGVRIEGRGRPLRSEPIYYDDNDDVAILHAPAAKGVPTLPLAGKPRAGTTTVVLGFPFGERYKAREARLGHTASPSRRQQRGVHRGHRAITPLRAGLGIGPGSSGSPVIDKRGRVAGMIFAGRDPDGGRDAFAIPSPIIRQALRRALSSPRRADTGDCTKE